jgi:two-component SAPR family response regulator
LSIIDVFNQQYSIFANVNHILNVIYSIIRKFLCKYGYCKYGYCKYGYHVDTKSRVITLLFLFHSRILKVDGNIKMPNMDGIELFNKMSKQDDKVRVCFFLSFRTSRF